MKLTKAKITKLTKRGMYGDGGGLYLQVAKGGSKSWIQRIMVNGKRRNIGLGGYPLISLTEARKASIEVRRDVYKGINPLTKKRHSQGLPLFVEVMQETFENKKREWTGEKVAANWMQRLDRHVMPKFGRRRINEIDQNDMIKLLKPLYEESPETGRKVRQALRSIFGVAMAKGLIDSDPAGERISAALPNRPKKQNHAALHNGEVSAFMRDIMACEAALSVRLAV